MNKQIKERGIIFNGEMVRAILDGRKTQTRRVIKNCTVGRDEISPFIKIGNFSGHYPDDLPEVIKNCCPFGKVGDRLWVKETMFPAPLETQTSPPKETLWNIAYRDGSQLEKLAPTTYNPTIYNYERWTPSIHMPRWTSRITLEITDIRVERLNDISEQDAAAEGVGSAVWFAAKGVPEDEWTSLGEFVGQKPYHINRFASLWESMYGQDSWQSNPFVWVVEFKRVEAGL